VTCDNIFYGDRKLDFMSSESMQQYSTKAPGEIIWYLLICMVVSNGRQGGLVQEHCWQSSVVSHVVYYLNFSFFKTCYSRTTIHKERLRQQDLVTKSFK